MTAGNDSIPQSTRCEIIDSAVGIGRGNATASFPAADSEGGTEFLQSDVIIPRVEVGIIPFVGPDPINEPVHLNISSCFLQSI